VVLVVLTSSLVAVVEVDKGRGVEAGREVDMGTLELS
jgi:hypothetical protein